jgi:hypothetical protein
MVNRIPVIAPILGQRKRGPFFKGVYLPQKLVLLAPIERQYKPFQKHVPSYQVKISERFIVWTRHTMTCAQPNFLIEE